MTGPEKLFREIVHNIPNAIEGKMFGALCIKTMNGKVAAIFWENNMLFKLGPEEQAEALELPGARPASHLYALDKPMKGWVLIPNNNSKEWQNFARKAIAHVSTLEK